MPIIIWLITCLTQFYNFFAVVIKQMTMVIK